jgi:hypothetical protein
LLVTDYVKTGVNAADTSNGNLPSAYAFDVPAGNGQFYISSTANQFTWTWDLVSKPHTVTVTTRFPTNGVNGLVRFPSPDPLHVGNGFTIITSGTFPVPATN